ncbi:MAG: class B sortase [Eubacterium sp.]|nr:class B sortase [Eubacterium sp.]
MTDKEKLEFVLGDEAEGETEDITEQVDTPAEEAAEPVKQPFFACVIPWKGDTKGGIIRKTVSLAVLIVSVAALAVTYNIYNDFLAEKEALEAAARAEAERDPTIKLGSITLPDAQIPAVREKKKAEILDEYKELYEINNDMVAYIEIEDTVVSYPVVQVKGFDEKKSDKKEISDANNYYLHMDFYTGGYYFAGTIIADYRAVSDENGRAANTLLYGHNMANGTMFADIIHYDPYYHGNYAVNFYKEHPIIKYDTLYEKGEYKIFAVMKQNVNTSEGEVFYYTRTYKFDSEAEFVDYYGQVLDRSLFYNPDVDLQYGDEVIALSTCDFSTGFSDKGIRLVLYARRVREGESSEVDVSKYYVNDDPLFFDYYYKYYGGSWGGRNWPASLLKNSEKYKTADKPTTSN